MAKPISTANQDDSTLSELGQPAAGWTPLDGDPGVTRAADEPGDAPDEDVDEDEDDDEDDFDEDEDEDADTDEVETDDVDPDK